MTTGAVIGNWNVKQREEMVKRYTGKAGVNFNGHVGGGSAVNQIQGQFQF